MRSSAHLREPGNHSRTHNDSVHNRWAVDPCAKVTSRTDPEPVAQTPRWVLMSGLVLLDALFAVLFGVVALYFLARLILGRGGPGDANRAGDTAHLLMAAGMAAMFVPAADPLP